MEISLNICQIYFQLVFLLAETVIDKFGRVLIPKKIRDKVGLKPGMRLDIVVKGNEIVLRPRNVDLEEKIRELEEFLEHETPKAFIKSPYLGDSKWFPKDYCLRKLGLLRE